MEILNLLLFAWFLLLASAFLMATLLRQKGLVASWISFAVFLCFGITTLFVLIEWNGIPLMCSWSWLRLGDWQVSMGIYFNDMAALVLLVVALVGFCVHFFSLGYMRKDRSKSRYFAGLSISMFSMVGIILSDNLVMIFFFWQLLTFSFYVLIAHYWKTKGAKVASKKAFIVNRVGDLGFLIGIIGCYYQYGTLNLIDLSNLDPKLGFSTYLALLLSCGFLSKSAQFPLQVWLPDSTAGPTPVSALLQTTTAVAAGVYLIARLFFLFSPEALQVILWGCAMMTVYASLCALAERDIKKILAYSTLAHLGFIGIGLGLGLPGLALLYMCGHAFFKTLLVLASGSVMVACDHQQDIFRLGGLWKKMPLTSATFAVGILVSCGMVFFSDYFGKGGILQVAYLYNKTVFYVVLFSAFISAIYMGRLFWIAFMGSANSQEARQAREGTWLMRLPLLILALLSIFGGYSNAWSSNLSSVFSVELNKVHQGIDSTEATGFFLFLGISVSLVGFISALYFYGSGAKEDKLEQRAGDLYRFLASKLWIDSLYRFYVDRIQQRIANLTNTLDFLVIGGLLVRGLAGVAGLLGMGIRLFHSGNGNYYVYWFLLGMVLFGLFAVGAWH